MRVRRALTATATVAVLTAVRGLLGRRPRRRPEAAPRPRTGPARAPPRTRPWSRTTRSTRPDRASPACSRRPTSSSPAATPSTRRPSRRSRRSRASPASTVISLSEAVIENQALTVAAVDPAAYRTFVPQRSANFQEAWDRVAGGELALKSRLKDKVPDGRAGLPQAGCRRRRARGARRRLHPAAAAGRRGGQPDLGRDARHDARQRAAGADRAQRPQAGAATRSRSCSATTRRSQLVDLATRSGIDPCGEAGRGRHRHRGRRRRRLPLHRARRRP